MKDLRILNFNLSLLRKRFKFLFFFFIFLVKMNLKYYYVHGFESEDLTIEQFLIFNSNFQTMLICIPLAAFSIS